MPFFSRTTTSNHHVGRRAEVKRTHEREDSWILIRRCRNTTQRATDFEHFHLSIHDTCKYINHHQSLWPLVTILAHQNMFVLKFFGLAAAVAVVVNAAPVDDPIVPHQLTPEEEAAQEAAFVAMSLEQRLEYHSEHKVYKPEGTTKCVVSICTERHVGGVADPTNNHRESALETLLVTLSMSLPTGRCARTMRPGQPYIHGFTIR